MVFISSFLFLFIIFSIYSECWPFLLLRMHLSMGAVSCGNWFSNCGRWLLVVVVVVGGGDGRSVGVVVRIVGMENGNFIFICYLFLLD